ncbi:hypothetical protein, partial [uncultured Helicobacter sp.]|uniref:hypothetical protein n=1 Tax=uncultured Helicobacter sp. TaxID=175537 RepID=UPI00261994BB
DSNISAAYGRFTGGVVEAFTRRANKPFGANISYQITQGNAQPGKFSMTHYHIYGNDASLDAFINASANGENQTNTPVFIKHLIRANLESQIDDKLGVIAAFATTQSFIPLRRSDNSYLNTTAYPIPEGIVQDSNGQAVQNQVRQIYNYFLKTHYDVDENLSFELTYTYAPDYNNRYLPGGKPDQSYDWVSGGHDVGFKTTWRNTLGKMTNTLGYSYLQNSTIAHGYEHTKEWRVSDAKNWSNWAGRAREGGYAPSESIQHTLSNKLIQDFKPLQDPLGIAHRFQAGFELGYQYARFGYTHDHFIARQTTTKLEANQTCPNLEWCDPSKTYFIKTSGTGANRTYTLEPWENGQYFYSAWLYRGSTTLDNTLLAAFAEDDMTLPLEYKGRDIGHINIRPGIRFDYDSYMDKLTTAPRLSLSYEAPWNELHHEFSTSMIAGANRYYGRNIFSYRLRADLNAMQTTIYRNDPNTDFYDVLAMGTTCPTGNAPVDNDLNGARRFNQNCIVTHLNAVKFNQLKVPYVDEFVIGFTQQLYDWSLVAKYIYRAGKDDIRYVRRDYANLPIDPSLTTHYFTFTNEGKSWSDVVTLTFTKNETIEFFNTKNYIFFAFDWTNVKRNFNDYSRAATANELQDADILYNGEVVAYSQRPASNFVRPYTLRLNTIHTFNVGKTKWLLNNFFRFRSAYDAITRIHIAGRQYTATRTPNPAYNPAHNNKDQYVPQRIREAFTWDMRLGFEVDVYKGNTLYTNIDIYNLLDAKNPTILNSNYAGTSSAPTLAYEVGRQFWVQVGYRY